MVWWSSLNVSRWPIVQREHRGRRLKFWVRDPDGAEWLRKVRRESRPYEPAIEAFSLELARRYDLPVSYGRACTWELDDGTVVRGFASRLFHDADEEQTPGRELLGQGIAADGTEVRANVMPSVARTALEELEPDDPQSLVLPFLRMLVFDGWLGNGDRHLGNWAVLRGECYRLAPMYDTASCLGAELLDGHQLLADPMPSLDAYVAGCRSGFGVVAGRGVRMRTTLQEISEWPEWASIATPLIEAFVSNFMVVDEVLSDIPDDWLPPARKRFARALLEARAKMLRETWP